jgi:SEC-C motif
MAARPTPTPALAHHEETNRESGGQTTVIRVMRPLPNGSGCLDALTQTLRRTPESDTRRASAVRGRSPSSSKAHTTNCPLKGPAEEVRCLPMSSEPRSNDALELLAAPPKDEYALLEFAFDWDGLDGAEAQLAAALRLFVITRDPLDWLTNRGSIWATANADGDTLELPVYITRDEVRRRMKASGGNLETTLGTLGETALAAATQCQGTIFAGAYPDLAFRGTVPRLLDQPDGPASHRAPSIRMRPAGWEPIGLGVIQDLVQDAFGPVDFDRSAVGLHPAQGVHRGCPACAGRRFGFPGELAEAMAEMCDEHRSEASSVTASRIDRARTSNRVGWRALGKGSARISGAPEPGGTPLPQLRRIPPRRNGPCPCGSGRKYKHCCGR